MKKKTIVAIDNDMNWLDRLKGYLDDLGLLADYDYFPIEALGRTSNEVVDHCHNEIKKLLTDNGTIEIVLVDIVIFEREEPPKDRSGLAVAKHLSSLLPDVPIVGMTRYISSHRLISEISLDPNLHGTLLKPFLDSSEFSRKDFLDSIKKAKEKVGITRKKDYSDPAEESRIVEGRFQLHEDDPRCLSQVLQIGRDFFMLLLESLFHSGRGTVKYLRPGFSGSYLFKVSVKTTEQGLSPSHTKTWVVKIADDKEKVRRELDRCIKLRSRFSQSLYPILLKEEVTVVNKWAAIAFEMQEDAVTFSEYFQHRPIITKVLRLIDELLIPSLKQYYGEIRGDPSFIWKKFYALDEKAKAGVLTFLDEAHSCFSRRFTALNNGVLKRIRDFIISNGNTESAITNFAGDIKTGYIHGDLNSRNILVADNASKLVFIDFANSDQEHYIKDIAKLETDLIFLIMDTNAWNHTDWERIVAWEQILELYKRGRIFEPKSQKTAGDSEVSYIEEVIQALRKGIKSLGGDQPDERQYLIALLHYTLKILSYPDVSIQKKILAVRCIQEILNVISQY